ncbi:hypothetical protein [Actinomadura macra]|uniref:hypothetical protein n=1 Tax=Actinomadura macra TaxID=46164 RepID=UPI0012F71BA5|nr:hypothetical protein [Actinomadura macra]
MARDHGRHISYARATPGHRTGTVTVRLADDGSAGVTYDLTGAAQDIDACAASHRGTCPGPRPGGRRR